MKHVATIVFNDNNGNPRTFIIKKDEAGTKIALNIKKDDDVTHLNKGELIIQENGEFTLFITQDEMNKVKSLEEMEDLVSKKINLLS